MRKRELKFHIIAVSTISIIVVLIYMALGKPTSDGGTIEVIGDRFIQIDNATWGRNCDAYVKEALMQWQMAGDQRTGPKPQSATLNNALTAVSSECNGKLECHLPTNSESLNVETVPSCFKRLTVGYRCFDYDRLNMLDVGQGEPLSINCREGGGAAPTAPAQ